VDLNALLYKYETDFAELLENQFAGKRRNLARTLATQPFGVSMPPNVRGP
jgi:hypothetical protein